MSIDLQVVGRHALLFDDDAMAAFVNSADALVDWNSLSIDRYDVRHLLSGPPPPRRSHRPNPDPLESELEIQRYLDLPSSTSDDGQQEQDPSSSPAHEGAGEFHAVGFSYGNTGDYADQKGMHAVEAETSSFSPPFPVPEYLLQCLPPTDKVHQIIVRTAKFVSEHGGQSEIVLRVKQGDNPTFGFLMPDHHLHAYFRFLVDHQELVSLNSGTQEEKQSELEQNQIGLRGNGALSLLGSLYGTGEDEDHEPESSQKAEDNGPAVTDACQTLVSQAVGKTDASVGVAAQKGLYKEIAPSKQNSASKRISSLGESTHPTSKSNKKPSDACTKHIGAKGMEKLLASDMLKMPKPEAIILEPPSDMKKLIDKIVEFVQRNGKEVEAVLREQDVKHGRFPFLISSNAYYAYYLKLLHKTQESATTDYSAPTKDKSGRHRKKAAVFKERESLSAESGEFPFDADRKEKFTMVLGKSKGLEPTSKAPPPSEVGMDAATVAAILQAATRGTKYSSFGHVSKTKANGLSNSESGQASSPRNEPVSQPQSSTQQHCHSDLHKPSVPEASVIAKTVALVAASEADSLEASMTKEQKLKAERLKRAKLFAAMLKAKGGAPPRCNSAERQDSGAFGFVRGLSLDRPESGASGLARGSSVERPEYGMSGLVVAEAVTEAGKEREGSSAPPDAAPLDKTEDVEMKCYYDDCRERMSKRSYRSKSNKENNADDEVSVHRKSRKKHRSQRSDHESSDDEDGLAELHSEKKHKSDDESDVDKGGRDKVKGHSRKKHKSNRSDDEMFDVDEDEEDHKRHSRKRHRSHRSSHESKERHRHISKEHSSRHRHGYHSSSDDEDHHQKRSKRHHKRRQSHKHGDLAEGEVTTKLLSEKSKAAEYEAPPTKRDVLGEQPELGREESSNQSRPSSESKITTVPDELRAKVRAMLLATL